MPEPTDPQAAPLPLARITVLDLTLARAGPTAVRHLADWGANVIRIEPPPSESEGVTGNRDGFDFQTFTAPSAPSAST
jgi:crotonobetainyl-CoA:carnitine CoA-transferase CaiB-like acyl-CoA transferase